MNPPSDTAIDERLRLADPSLGVPAAAARQAALEARALAARLARPVDHARASAWLCGHLLQLGEFAQVLAEAPAALAQLQALGLHAERLELLRVTVLAGSETGAFDVALDAAHELVRITASGGDAGAALSAAFALGACFERMGDSWQAVRLLAKALADHGEVAPDRPLLIATNGMCAMSLGMMHRLKGTGEDEELHQVLAQARDAGERARALLERVPNPAYEVAVLGNLGEVLIHQGETATGLELLQRAHAQAGRHGLAAHVWRVQASLGDVLLRQGQPERALASARSVLAEMGQAGPPQTKIRLHDVAYRACKALRLFGEALEHFETVERLERGRATAQLRAQSRLFVTRTEAQHAHWLAEQARTEALEHRRRAAEFAASAELDPLTGLGNRRHLERRCADLLPEAQRASQPLALAQIDVDHFKSINDDFGHPVGDRVLVSLAELLRENTRGGDVIARQGGEEFVIVLPGMSPRRAAEVCERLRQRVAAHDFGLPDAPTRQVTISLGLSAAPPYDARVLLQLADAALYAAKRGGRNRLELA